MNVFNFLLCILVLCSSLCFYSLIFREVYMFIYSCNFTPLCFDKALVRVYGLDRLIRDNCKDCPFGGFCFSEDCVPDGVWYTSDGANLISPTN